MTTDGEIKSAFDFTAQPSGSPGMGASARENKDTGAGHGAPAPILAALAKFRERKSAPQTFTVPTRAFTVQRQKDKAKQLDRRKRQASIRPENAAVLLPHLPATEDDRLHALLAGDFVFCSLITSIVAHLGPPRRIVCSTLSMSLKNLAAIGEMLAPHSFPFDLLLSTYFANTNANIYAAAIAVSQRQPRLRIRKARSHAKVTLFDYPDRPLVLETSANLRSSDSLEQLTVFCDRELLDFHIQWIEEAAQSNQ